ncbi:MAG TPA: DEAD/DEAH box helicase [Gemmatimonadaceae bacterium]|nr:DEAD/DEAH box helicase [Gemmatimonadaceae bacterium]
MSELQTSSEQEIPAEPSLAALNGFTALGLADPLVSALAALGYEEPTPIQREAIPPMLGGRDLLGQAATGTGKTAAFALPLLQRIKSAPAATADADEADAVSGGAAAPRRSGAPGPGALVLVPTRELAMQVAEATHKYGRGLGVRVLPVYGGAPMAQQLRALERGVDVVIATPGRALDHIRRRSLRLDTLKVLVLDEADEMLDMGFEDDLQEILEATPKERQTALFSATMAPRIAAIAARHLRNPVEIRIAREAATAGVMPRVRQTAYIVPRAHKTATLGRVLDMESPTSAIVFCRTRHEVDELVETLNARGYRAEALHGGFTQEQRDRVMKKFRAGTAELLIATDVAARGLDIEHLSHVINYDVPSAPEAYVHRIGRTGRAGREGVAITIAEPREHRQLRNIEHLTKTKIELATVPTVADLKARRLELTKASLREALVPGEDGSALSDLDRFRGVVESLASEFDLMDVAAAAVKLAHASTTGESEAQEAEIPVFQPREASGPRRDAGGSGGGARGRFDRGERSSGGGGGRFERGERGDREVGGPPHRERTRGDAGERDRSGPGGGERTRRPKRAPDWAVTKIYVGAGRKAGVRPGDLVGAIANEVGIESSAIGAIEIADRFALVEVPEEIAEEIIGALRGTTIKGKRVVVRRDRDVQH